MNAGAAYVYSRSGATWTFVRKMTAKDGSTGDYFGRAVSIFDIYGFISSEHDGDKATDAGHLILHMFKILHHNNVFMNRIGVYIC